MFQCQATDGKLKKLSLFPLPDSSNPKLSNEFMNVKVLNNQKGGEGEPR